MGVYHPYDVICPACEHRYTVQLVDAVNVSRFPDLKVDLLSRRLNRARCVKCGYEAVVEKAFLYVDLDRRLQIAVFPRKERHFHVRASGQVSALMDAFKGTKAPQVATGRVVFGLEELREKVVAADASYDDDRVELMKLFVLREHPFLFGKRRLRISLDAVAGDRVAFNCTFDHDGGSAFQVNVPRAFMDALNDTAIVEEKVARYNIPGKAASAPVLARKTFAASGRAPWVNFWKLNPSNDALAQLSAFAEAIRAGKAIDVDSKEFSAMLGALPAGNQLPSWAKRDLQTLVDYAKKLNREEVENALFEKRFGFDLDDDWFRLNKDRDDITEMWRLLQQLPDIAVEGNTWIKSIQYDVGGGRGGYYTYWTTSEIFIGSGLQSGEAGFRQVFLHEVGHSVQKKLDTEKASFVTKWLATAFGWQVFDPNRPQEIDAWVDLAGGYPMGTSEKTKIEIRSYLQQSLGAGNTFKAAKIIDGPQGHVWNSSKFGARRALENSGSDWWENCKKWHLVNGRRLFVNYHYRWLMAVDDATASLAGKMPDLYALMSPLEFFAELFAWNYDSGALRRDNIPPEVAAWFNTNVGLLEAASPFSPPARTATGKARTRKTKKRVRD